MREFKERTAVVTGAARGIGRALAQRFGQEGMNLVLADIDETALSATVEQFRQEGISAVGVPTDVSEAGSVEGLAQAALDAFGKVHILCNNAGVALDDGLIWERTLADWEWGFRVNVWGVIHGIRAFLPAMLAHGEEGHVINTASVAGLTPNLLGAYAVTKRTVVSLTEYLARSLQEADAKLGASVLCPGFVRTEILASSRYRQRHYRNPRGMSPRVKYGFLKRLQARIESGAAPEAVASLVIDAIREERFWILTGDEDKELIRTYFESLLEGTNPVLSQDVI